jgi:excisionase family DNA binding protein
MAGLARAGPQPHLGVERPRLVALDQIDLSTPLDPYLALRALATYCGCSVKWLRQRLVDARDPLPCYRVGGKILVRRSEFDAWMERFRQVGDAGVERLLRDVLDEDRR